MRFINNRFFNHKMHFFLQSCLMSALIFASLFTLMNVEDRPLSLLSAIGASSLSASAFIMFALPHSPAAMARRVIFGYLIAMLCGVIFHELALYAVAHCTFYPMSVYAFFAALAFGCAMLMMGGLGLEHPPAIGFTLGLVLERWDYLILLVVGISIIVFSIIRFFIKRWLIDLV